jgi:Zinc knuckle
MASRRGGRNAFGGRDRGGRWQNRNRGQDFGQRGVRIDHTNKRPYLNFTIGSSPQPGVTQAFMQELGILAALECPKSGIAKIFKDDGTIANEYILRGEPEVPEDEEDEFAKMRYSNELKSFMKWEEDLEEEKRKLVALVMSCLGPDSKARVREIENARGAIENDDPRELLIQIIASHNTDHLQDNSYMAVVALRKFHNLQQGENEATGVYFNRFNAVEKSTRTILTNNGDDPDDIMPSERQRAVMFTTGLNNRYREYKSSFTNGRSVEGYPITMAEAYKRALKAAVDEITYRTRIDQNSVRGLFIAGRGNYAPHGQDHGGGRNNQGGGRGKYRGRGRQNYGGGRGEDRARLCFICREAGHMARDCPHRDDAVINEAVNNLAQNESN